ncbi:MAG: type I 3-dehydroquinate dehydratase [Clostridia bacterium]|nr:type I 3-dehydroquinate dehydratase [Clostridia bacterium]
MKSFLNSEKAILTCMVQANDPDRIKELIDLSLPEGAEAFGMQFERLKAEYRAPETCRELFAYTNKPVYVTNYRYCENVGKSDDILADELLTLAECGATLCDVMGDYFAPCEGELTMDEVAVKKQVELIGELHKRGAEVLMSSHVLKFTPAERVLEIALEHQRRGADICKIVTGASNMEEQLENLSIVNMLKEKLEIPFLFLSGGKCHILRRIGASLGVCMYLCVHEYDELATKVQPLLCDVRLLRDLF